MATQQPPSDPIPTPVDIPVPEPVDPPSRNLGILRPALVEAWDRATDHDNL